MRLRKQLLLVSLFMLVLPWAGCQYIREMETALRTGQIAALEATAKAVAVTLASDDALAKKLSALEVGPDVIYAHSLPSELAVDGYVSDWWSIDYQMQPLISDKSPMNASVVAGRHQEKLFIYLRVRDDQIVYFNPSDDAPYDHLSLHLKGQTDNFRSFKIYTSVPGSVEVLTVHSNTLNNGTSRREYRIKGAWVESEFENGDRGYQVELQLPYRWAEGGLELQIHNSENHSKTYKPENLREVKSIDADINLALKNFASNELRLRFVSQGAWVLANQGDLKFYQERTNPREIDFRSRVYQLLVKRLRNSLDNPMLEGRYQSAEVLSALAGTAGSTWYQHGGDRVGRVAVPVFNLQALQNPIVSEGEQISSAQVSEPKVLGAVVAEQTSSNMVALTNSAFSRLLFYTLTMVCVAGFALLAYASWLSYRIRQLSLAAGAAISEAGNINTNFPVSKSQDELGDLSRRFHQLLTQLELHTSYLKTLASKLSHELRTPLAVVKSSLDNLEHQQLDESASVYTARAKEGADRLSKILNAMSAANRIEQSIQYAEKEPLELNEFLSFVVEAYRDAYAPQEIEYNSAIVGSVFVEASTDLLVQMLDKLVDNAIDFTLPNKAITLSLFQEGEQVNISVINFGPLLPEPGISQLFQSLVSLRQSDKADVGAQHLGLGLYIVKLIAESHGGSVKAYNKNHEGLVVFSVSIPVLSTKLKGP